MRIVNSHYLAVGAFPMSGQEDGHQFRARIVHAIKEIETRTSRFCQHEHFANCRTTRHMFGDMLPLPPATDALSSCPLLPANFDRKCCSLIATPLDEEEHVLFLTSRRDHFLETPNIQFLRASEQPNITSRERVIGVETRKQLVDSHHNSKPIRSHIVCVIEEHNQVLDYHRNVTATFF